VAKWVRATLRAIPLVAVLAGAALMTRAGGAIALEESVADAGIGARELHAPPYNLTGRKIAIGQVELGRPRRFGLDKAEADLPQLNPAGVFYRDRAIAPNLHVDAHAQMVATVMVAQGKRLRGVAPDALLYAGALGSLRGAGQPEECLTAQHIAERNSGDLRAINFSFGESLERDARPEASLDGNALLTLCVDWSARVHDVLYAIAGNQGQGGIPIPTDNYNGVTLAYTTRRGDEFAKIDFANLSAAPVGIGRRLIAREINVGARRAVSLVAPGSQIELVTLDGRTIRASGSSFATPHLTATVALLQEYGDRRLRGDPVPSPPVPWSLDSRRHEVMKAVVLNSAEKVRDRGDGRLLGMERTISTKRGATWFESDAARDPAIPLDYEMGTGQLDAVRAYEQFAAGQWTDTGPVPARGWNYGTVSARSPHVYELAAPLAAGSHAAVTLAWDRYVKLIDRDGDRRYDVGEQFRDLGLNDLNVYLVPLGADKVAAACSSVSAEDSVEHLFCPVPQTGRYAIRVEYANQVHAPIQPYAIAWWTTPSGATF